MLLIFILVVYRHQPEPLGVLFLLASISSAVEVQLNFDIQDLSLQVFQYIMKIFSSNVDASASTFTMGFNYGRIRVAFQS